MPFLLPMLLLALIVSFLSVPATCATGSLVWMPLFNTKKPRIVRGFFVRLIDTDQTAFWRSAGYIACKSLTISLMDTNVSSCNDVTFSSVLSIALQWGKVQSTWSHQCQSLNCPGTHKFIYVTAHIASIWSRKRFRFPSRRRLAHHVCTRFHYQIEIGRIVNLLLVFRSNCQRTTFKLLVLCNNQSMICAIIIYLEILESYE